MRNIIGAKSWSLSLFTGALVGMLLPFPTNAQSLTSCPDTVTNPLEVLQGTWGFNTAGTGLPFSQRPRSPGQARRLFDNSPDNSPGSGLRQGLGQPVASAGSFLASMGTDANGNQIGALTVTTTTSRNGQIVPMETGTGSYHVLPDCSGGTLTFNLESGPVSYNFFFGTSGDISLVGTDPGDTIWGLGKAPMIETDVTTVRCGGGDFEISNGNKNKTTTAKCSVTKASTGMDSGGTCTNDSGTVVSSADCSANGGRGGCGTSTLGGTCKIK